MAKMRDELREMARGFRWGRRPLVPADALEHTPVRERGVFPTAWARTPTAKAARHVLQSYALKPLVWMETDPRVEGLDALEGLDRPVIFVSNHSSHLDATLILTSLPPEWRRHTATAAAADYFFDTWYRSIFTSVVYNGIPLQRSGARGRATDLPRQLMREGWNLIIFPEGSRSRDGFVQRFRSGTARLALELEVPVVPIGIRGAAAAMPAGAGWPVRGRPVISIRYGAPIRPEPGETHQALTKRIHGSVARLLDEDRTSWWESVHRAERGETPSPAGPQAPRWRRVWEGTRKVPPPGPRRAWPSGS